MSLSIALLLLSITFVAMSMLHVYRWRGDVQFPSFLRYLRKSWPVFAPLNCLLLRAAGPRLKRKNRKAYVMLKIMLNVSLVLLVFMAIFSTLQLAEAVGSATVF